MGANIELLLVWEQWLQGQKRVVDLDAGIAVLQISIPAPRQFCPRRVVAVKSSSHPYQPCLRVRVLWFVRRLQPCLCGPLSESVLFSKLLFPSRMIFLTGKVSLMTCFTNSLIACH